MKHSNSFKCMSFLYMTILITGGGGTALAEGSLVLWNKLGSQTEIENSDVGLNGTFAGGEFTQGMFGNAYVADYTVRSPLVTFPKEVIPIEAGTIELWAKLINPPSVLEWGGNPLFAHISDGTYSGYAMHLNGNDGAGNGGLCGSAGHGTATGTGSFGFWTYEQVLGAGQEEEWHHYALVWDENGVAGVDNGARRVAVFLNGQLNSGRWYEPDPDFVPLTGGELGLAFNQHLSQGSVVVDNIKIWDFAKTEFSDRFDEAAGAGPELSIASGSPAAEDQEVDVDVAFTGSGSSIAATTFSIDYDEDCLFFDPIDFDPVDGIPDNLAVHVPGDFTATVFHDLGDEDGEIDVSISDLSPPIATLPDGALVTATFTATCSPAVPEHIDANVGFSADPSASFSDDAAQDVDGATVDGSVRIYPGPRGDCNFNGSVTAADLIADALEIFDGDGSFWGDVPGGSFAGSPVGCDANADTEVTAGDVSCTVRLIFGDTCGAQERPAPTLGGWAPTLEIDGTIRVERGAVVRIPVRLRSRGHGVASVAFSLDLNPQRLRFDPSDRDRDGVPDAVSFPQAKPWFTRASFDARDRDGELDLVLGAGPGAVLADGLLLEIEVEALRAGPVAKGLSFSETPAATFGDAAGRGMPGGAVVLWKGESRR